MQKNSGFTLIEVLIAASILFTTVSTFMPLILIVDAEQKVLSDRRNLASILHDELQHVIWDTPGELPLKFTETLNSIQVRFEFNMEQEFIKGCVAWNNAKQREERLCLYGLQAS
ncbi:type II secretion system protein [Oceanobacillus sp. CF4.6]|uniref:type II secretion system protein n=1 Tax=Oceanobacillus sp. CF4.6 TaxID=3373080 RepID=UPI003EE77B80